MSFRNMCGHQVRDRTAGGKAERCGREKKGNYVSLHQLVIAVTTRARKAVQEPGFVSVRAGKILRGPLPEGCEPLLLISIFCVLLCPYRSWRVGRNKISFISTSTG